MAEPWMRSGLFKGHGIPAPSGERSVGCVDLMHQFEGDNHGPLLVRLFYPAQLNASQPRGLPETYTSWSPNKLYLKAYFEFQKTWTGAGLLATITNAVLNPRMPAVLEAALLGTYLQLQSTSGDATGTNEDNSTQDNVKEVYVETQESSERVNLAEPLLFPVIIFSHGLGGMRTTYSGICCDLASNGYVVASVEHRDRSACVSYQRVINRDSGSENPQFHDKWIDFYHKKETEKEFTLRNKQATLALELLTMLNEGLDVNNMMDGNFNFKQFQSRLDVRKAAIMGHSFGGATTIQALNQDQRFLCGIAMDCYMLPIHRDLLETGVHQPLLFINSYNFHWPDNVRKMMKLTRPHQGTRASSCNILTLKGTNHANQSDALFVLPKFFQRWTKRGASPLDPTVAHKLNMDICHAFLKRYQLRDPAYWEQSVPNLDGCDGHSDLIIFGSNIDTKIPSENGPSHLVTDNTTKAEVNGSSVTGPQKEGTENDESAKVKESSSDSENAAKL